MSEVTLLIEGKHYTVACAPGQEAQVEKLAGVIEAKIKQLGSNVSASPAQNLVFAALLLADELDEVQNGSAASAARPDLDAELQESRRTVDQLKLELEALRTEHDEALRDLASAKQAAPPESSHNDSDAFLELAENIAASLEACATRLEDAVGAS